MPRNNFLKFDFKTLNDLKNQLPKGATEALDKFQSQLLTYEEKVVDLVKSLEENQVKVRKDVEKLGKQRLNRFASDLKKTRSTVEKRVLNLVGEKRKDIQSRVNELVIYLSGLAGKDVFKSRKKGGTKTKKASKKPAVARKTKAKRVLNSTHNARNTSARVAESLSQA